MSNYEFSLKSSLSLILYHYKTHSRILVCINPQRTCFALYDITLKLNM
nr:MAG TPA: hypothetical protein [Caudoviricetes sp.]